MAIVLILLIASVFGLLFYFEHYLKTRRTAGLAALAEEFSWTFRPQRDSRLGDPYHRLNVFRNHRGGFLLNTLEGWWEGRGFRMGDFDPGVPAQDGKQRQKTSGEKFSYLLIETLQPEAPPLLIRPEHAFDKVGSALGLDDIDFESAEFSRRFHVQSPDRRFAYAVVHPRMIEFLLQTTGVRFEVQTGWCCVLEGDTLWSPDEFRNRIEEAARFLALWPKHLRDELNASTAWPG